jgi:hypothetical protein
MGIAAFEQRWAALSEEVLTGMRDWRVQHPPAATTTLSPRATNLARLS